MGTLTGRVAIVTGAGVSLSGGSTGDSPARTVTDAILAAGGIAEADERDITDFAAVGELVESTVARHGKLDIVVNVAGILRDRMIFNMSEQEWDQVMQVHLKGHFNLTRHASAYWRQAKNPNAHHRLINFTSGSGLHGAPGQPNYAAAKMGIIGLTFSSANALARYGVTVNAIAPAALTRMTANTPSERRSTQWEEDEQWLPENVVPIVAYLAGEQSDWCTGRVISTRGYEVALYSNPQPVRTLRAPKGGWDLELLGKAVEAEFRPLVEEHPLRGPVEQASYAARNVPVVQC
jgi:NAD(P)-dependent dehydrogenase (short-subunit alcohol dehydrogenase family)